MFNEEEIRTEVFKQKPLDFNPQAYVTAAYVEVADQLLLLQLSNLKKEPNKWGVPAGRLEADELPEEGLRRELFEETSISIDPQTPIHSIGQLYIRRPGMDYIYHAFRVQLSHMPQVILSNEHIAYKWVSASEAKELPLMKGAKEALQFYLDSQECLRSTIHRMVSAIVPFDRLEEEHIDFVKNWISSGAEIFRLAKPDQPHIHLVSYFIIVDQQTHQFLLVDHKKAQLWLPPGGHVEVNEHPQETVKREIKEELGIEATFLFEDPLFLTVTNTVGHIACHTDVSLWYILKGNNQDDLKYDPEEFHQVRWFKRQEIPFTQTDPHMKRFVDKVINKLVTLSSYDASAVQYAKNTDPLHPKEDAQKFLDLLPKSATVIDIGCGPGRDAKIFSDHKLHVVGIDFSTKMIDAARKNAPDSIFYVMDIESLAFPPNTFDGAWANCALLHIPKKNIPLVLSKIYALLKPKGVLYVSVKQHHVDELLAPDVRYEGLEKYWSFYGQDELMNLLGHAGFKIIEAEISGKKSDYQTHPIIKIYAQKPAYY